MPASAAACFEATLPVPQTPMLFWYDFIVHTPEGDLRYGNRDDGLGGEGQVVYDTMHAFQITVYDPAYETPEYLREGILYQVFPDRFFRGGAEPSPGADGQSSKQRTPRRRFTNTWNEPPTLDLDPENGDNRALDFFGGTLKGIEEKLALSARSGRDRAVHEPHRARAHQPPLRYGRLPQGGPDSRQR